MALLSSLTEPLNTLTLVLTYAVPFKITISKTVLSISEALLSSLTEPLNTLTLVLIYAFPAKVFQS